jgi:hypothetical protein
VEALHQAGRCGEKPVAVPGVGLTGEDHEEDLPDWVATKVTLPATAALSADAGPPPYACRTPFWQVCLLFFARGLHGARRAT